MEMLSRLGHVYTNYSNPIGVLCCRIWLVCDLTAVVFAFPCTTDIWNYLFAALFVAVVVDSALISNITSQSQATLSNAIQSAQIFMSLSTTVITTALIAYRIRSTLKLSRTSAKGFFSHVVEIIVESAAVYSIVVLVYAIITVVVQYPQVGSFVAIAGAYLQSIITIVGVCFPSLAAL